MVILHILSQNQLTGAEVHAATLIDEQINSGHTVYQLSNQFFKNTKAQQIHLAVETKNIFQFFKSIFKLRSFLIQNNVQVIHSHSRAASKLSSYARLNLKIGHVSTVHGRQHVSFSKKIFNQYGEFIIPVCKNISTQLTSEFFYNPRRIKILANPIKSNLQSVANKKSYVSGEILQVAIIGRTTGPKKTRTDLFIKHFSALLDSKKIAYKFILVGGHFKLACENQSSGLIKNSEINTVEIIEHAEINNEFLQKFDLICGSGRVAMESILAQVPCIAFGESKYIGLIKSDNFAHASESCFGDIGFNFDLPTFDSEQALSDINLFLEKSVNYSNLAQIAQKLFDSDTIYKQVQRIYESAYFIRNYSKWIPILMYHKIPDKNLESKHKIYVTKENFEKHLQIFKKLKLTTLTFEDLAFYRKGLKDWNTFPKNPLILTFDDGYSDNISNADPLLKKYQAKAQIYLLANQAITGNSWDLEGDPKGHHDIVSEKKREKWINTNFTIGSHGLSHERLPMMTQSQKMFELAESKKQLELEFNKKIITYAYTYGDTDLDCAEAAQLAGYEYAVNTDSGGFIAEESPYSIFRVNIFPDETFSSLWKKTRKWYRKYYYIKRNK